MHDTSQDGEQSNLGYTQDDWDAVSDNPEMTDAELAELQPASAVPEVFRLLPKRGRGRPKRADAKVNLTLRIDPALLNAYRATGDGWQVRMHAALADGVTRFGAALTTSKETPARVGTAARPETRRRVSGQGIQEPADSKPLNRSKTRA